MSVERRYSARHPIDLKVHLRYRRRHFSCARAGNLSTDGIYLRVRNVTLPEGTMVELDFEALGRAWLIPAIVVHRRDGGIGLMFRDPQPDLFRAMMAYRARALLRPAAEVAGGAFARD